MKLFQQVGHCEQTQETLALLKVLTLTNADVEEGKVRSVGEAFKRIHEHVKG